MKVIALIGQSSSGKSHTLGILYSLLLNSDYSQVDGNYRCLGNPEQDDFIDILQKENIRIGIFSMGDYAIGLNGVKNLLHELKIKDCNIAFCACTASKIKTIQAVEEYTDYVKIAKKLSNSESSFRIDNYYNAKEMQSFI